MMLRPLPWASLITNSLAPASIAPSQAATHLVGHPLAELMVGGMGLVGFFQLVMPVVPSISALI